MPKPTVVLLDIMMPTMDGLQAYEHLQADPTTRDIPVILFTARGRAGMWRSGDAGIRGLIPKPYDPMGLGDQIIEILGGREPTGTPPRSRGAPGRVP